MWQRSDYNGSQGTGGWTHDPPMRSKADAHEIVRRWEQQGLKVIHEDEDLIVVLGLYHQDQNRAGEVYITVWRWI